MMTKSNVTQKSKVTQSRCKLWAKQWATGHHNFLWIAAAIGLSFIFFADSFFNGWVGLLLGGWVLCLLFLSIELGMAYCLGEIRDLWRGRFFRGVVCLIGFIIGAYCSVTCLKMYNAYQDATKSIDYTKVKGLERKQALLGDLMETMFETGNPDNGAQRSRDMVANLDSIIESEHLAQKKLGYNPALAYFYQGEKLHVGSSLSGSQESANRLIHLRVSRKVVETRNWMSYAALGMGIILTLVFAIRPTVAEEYEVEEANMAGEEEAHLLNDHPKPKTARVRVPAGADVFAHSKPSMWQRLRGKAA